MKKLSILLALSAMAMVSCQNAYEPKTVSLSSQEDSINYALGLSNGAQIKMYYLYNDSTKQAINEFMDGLVRGYEGTNGQLTELQQVGINFGIGIQQMQKSGIINNAAWTLNQEIFFQGLINGIYQDTTMMTASTAQEFFQSKYSNNDIQIDSLHPQKVNTKKCGVKVRIIALNSALDSLNYAFGYLNGNELAQGMITDEETKDASVSALAASINKGLKDKTKNVQLVRMAENIGQQIKEQEPVGLVGVEGLGTDFEMLKQGFINGFYQEFGQMTLEQANEYIQTTINNMKYGKNLAEGEEFLAQNALRDGVTTTESGLQYEIIKEGKGKVPTTADKVKVHYHGTLIDGTVFDSSVDRGEPIVFGVTQVIKGWTEALQMMPVGSKWKLYIPYDLAYGEREAGQIPPYSTLIFEVELLGIEK